MISDNFQYRSNGGFICTFGHNLATAGRRGELCGRRMQDVGLAFDFGVIVGYRDGYARTSPVGSSKANRFGLYDMSGNLWEWCDDFFDGQSGTRVLRGGAWCHDFPRYLLSSFRGINIPGNRSDGNGFRCVLVLAGATR